MKQISLILLLLALGTNGFAGTPSSNVPKTHCCITDPQGFYFDDESRIRKRFDLYRSVGVDTIRMEVDWAVLEQSEGQWDPGKVMEYLKIAKDYGFRIKLIMGVMMAPPAWFLDSHPDAMLTDQNGGHSRGTMSYWYPELRKVIDEKTRKICSLVKEAGVWDSIDYIIPTFGPAGEPIYPHPWTLGPAFPDVTFWGYDINAQKDFRTNMKRKYKTIENANKSWGTDFGSWEEVNVPKPKTVTGKFWEDMLIWYRDSKRRFVEWQIDNARKNIGNGKKILIYVPGTSYSEQDWVDAVRTGDGNVWIKLMADSMFLIDTAAKKKCWLQYTGVENADEVARLRKYLDDRKYADVEMWGENAGSYECAKDPVRLAEIIIQNRLYGLDFTHAHFALEEDGVTPNHIMPELKKAYRMINEYWASRESLTK